MGLLLSARLRVRPRLRLRLLLLSHLRALASWRLCSPPQRRRSAQAEDASLARRAGVVLFATLLAACATEERIPTRSTMTTAEIRAMIVQAIPTGAPGRSAWAADIHTALDSLQIAASAPNVCSVVAITEQESSFRADPKVPGLAQIAWREIDGKAERAGVPKLLVHTTLKLPSSDGRSYADRIDAATTERELSEIFEDFIGIVPMGKKFFSGWNPVRTGGPMQVSIGWSQAHAARKPYPYPVKGSIRDEVFTRRGGVYFGTAHLLDYAASYDRPIYRFADFNAGHYASRNAAFQSAVSQLSRQALDLDGDLVSPDPDGTRSPGATEAATRRLATRLGLDASSIRAALELEKSPQFERSALYDRVFRMADEQAGQRVPRAVLPKIVLKSPKITRQLTTEWFANRVDERHRQCMARIAAH